MGRGDLWPFSHDLSLFNFALSASFSPKFRTVECIWSDIMDDDDPDNPLDDVFDVRPFPF